MRDDRRQELIVNADSRQIEGTLNHLCGNPGVNHAVVDTGLYRAIINQTGGEVLFEGHIWEIRRKSLGAKMYRISLGKVI